MAKGYGALVDVLGGPQSFLQFKMLESRTYEGLADANARAINGLQPKITTWNTGKCPLCKHSQHVSPNSGDDREWRCFWRIISSSDAKHHAESPSSLEYYS